MTYDELLAELDELDHSCSVVGITVSALRAVVELHSPMESFPNVCSECAFEAVVLYPCPTIQAIEEALK